MRKSILGITLASALALTAPAFGKVSQEKDHTSTAAEKAGEAGRDTRDAAQHTGAAARDTAQEAGAKTREHVKTKSKADVTYGRIKDLQAGQKIVVDVDNSMDKSFDLTDKDNHVTIAKTLKVGDPVKVTESERNGKKWVTIVKDNNHAMKHGDKSAAEEARESKQKRDVRTDTDTDAAHNSKTDKNYKK